MKSMKILGCVVASGLFLIYAGACSRSNEYKKDKDYYGDYPHSYYSGPGESPVSTKRAATLGQPRKRLVVLNFWNDTPIPSENMGPSAGDELRRELYLSKRVIIPTDVKQNLDTKDFVQGDKVKVAQLVREGRRMGVAVVVIGRISNAVFRQKGDSVGLLRQKESIAAIDLEMKVFDVSSGREVMAIAKTGNATSNSMVAVDDKSLESQEYRDEIARLAIRDAVQKVVPPIVQSIDKLNWEGRVAKVTGEKVYVNAGHQSGLVAGDILKILTPGEEIFDPASGAFLGQTAGQLKGTVEVVDFVGRDAAVGVLHTGGQFREGDVVKLY